MKAFRSGTHRDERGANAVEYGLLVAMIAAVIVVAVLGLGDTVRGFFNDTCTSYRDTSGQVQDCDN